MVLSPNSSLPRREKILLASAGFLGILACWQTVATLELVDPFFLPAPARVLSTLGALLLEQGFLFDVYVSLSRVTIAFALSVVAALPTGLAMALSARGAAVLEPFVDFVRYLPVPALVPLCILWLGIGETSKIVLLFIGTFFQLVLLIADDVRSVPSEFIDAGYTLGASTSSQLRRVIIPAALPSIYDDLRVTLGWCWTYLLVAEIVAARNGIGYVIQQAQRYARPATVIAGIVTIGVIGLLTDAGMRLGHRLLFRYLHRVPESSR